MVSRFGGLVEWQPKADAELDQVGRLRIVLQGEDPEAETPFDRRQMPSKPEKCR